MLCRTSGGLAPGHEHRHPLAIALVFVAEQIDQVTLFEEDSDEDVGRRYRREQEMPDRHGRRHPERDDEAEIDRMTYDLVEHGRPEPDRWHVATDQVVHHLVHAEQF